MRKYRTDIGRDQEGATAVEYGLILALVFLAMITGIRSFGMTAIDMWNNMSTSITSSSS